MHKEHFLVRKDGKKLVVIMKHGGEAWNWSWQTEREQHNLARFFNKKNGRIIPVWSRGFHRLEIMYWEEIPRNALRVYEMTEDGQITKCPFWGIPIAIED